MNLSSAKQKDRRAAGNRRLAQWQVTWLIEHSTLHQLLWCSDSLVLQNPPERKARKRYASCLPTELTSNYLE